MKAQVLLLITLYFVSCNLTAQTQNELQISLLTCSSGSQVHSAFGHSSIRVVDPITGQDIAFDYGVFSFDEPNFVWRFLRGELDYKLAARSFTKFKHNYKLSGRGVIEEQLNLSQQDKETLYRFLQNNLKPENRFYRYEFIYDNCSTRIRDITELLPHIKNPHNEEILNLTFRDNLNSYLGQQKWFKFGIDLLLGSRLDEKMTFRQQMFLPNNLSENLRESVNTKTKKPLLQAPVSLLKKQETATKTIQQFTQPLVVFSVVFLLLILLFFTKPKWLNKLAPLVFFVAGFLGLFLIFMWFGTTHNGTKNNWNIAWLNPLFMLLILPFSKQIKRYLLWVLIIINILILLGFAVLPQAINVAAIPIISTLILSCWARLSVTENS